MAGSFGKMMTRLGFDPSKQGREKDGKFGRNLNGTQPPTPAPPHPPNVKRPAGNRPTGPTPPHTPDATYRQYQQAVTETHPQWAPPARPTPPGGDSWNSHNFHPDDRAMFQQAGISPTQAQKWVAAGIHGHEAHQFYQAEIATLDQAKQWIGAGIRGHEARKYRQAHISTPGDAHPWIVAGIGGDEAHQFHQTGITIPAQAQQWTRMGIRGDEARKYRQAHINTPEQAHYWKTLGISGDEAHTAYLNGVRDPHQIAQRRTPQHPPIGP